MVNGQWLMDNPSLRVGIIKIKQPNITWRLDCFVPRNDVRVSSLRVGYYEHQTVGYDVEYSSLRGTKQSSLSYTQHVTKDVIGSGALRTSNSMQMTLEYSSLRGTKQSSLLINVLPIYVIARYEAILKLYRFST